MRRTVATKAMKAGIRSRLRGKGIGAGGLSVVVLGLLILPAGAGAASTHPYHGNVTTWSYTGNFGCAHDMTSHPWTFNLTSGHGGWAGAASSKSCGGLNSSSYIESGVDISVPLAINTSGLLAVKVKFLVSFHTVGTVSRVAPCASAKSSYTWGFSWTGSCEVGASVFNAPYLSIYDRTAHAWASVNSPKNPFNVTSEIYEYVDWGCYNAANGGGCWNSNYSYMSHAKGWDIQVKGLVNVVSLPGYFTAGHHYVLYIDGATYVGTDAWGWALAGSSSSMNFGTHGNGVTLRSITVV